MAKRKSMSNALRFEVFKRDLFTCQYCGRKAPDVILEVDHIKPVSKGGDNSIENLVTACWDCNRGKGAKKLSDLSEVEKSRKQLEEIQARKNMIDMIFQWKESIYNQYDDSVERINNIFSEQTGYKFNGSFVAKVKNGIKKFGLDIMIDAIHIAIDKYYNGEEDGARMALSMYLGIASNLYDSENNPTKSSITYIKNILKRNCVNFNQRTFYIKFPKWYTLNDKDDILTIAMRSTTLDRFFYEVSLYEETREDK